MRLHVLSDLHCEFGGFEPPAVKADVTLLAGDTFTKGRLCPWDNAEAAFGRPVVAVCGNHEFYCGKIDTMVPKLQALSPAKRMMVLERDEFRLGDQLRVLGCTLWADFRLSLTGDEDPMAALDEVRRLANICVGDRRRARINDFHAIRVAGDAYRRFRPRDAAQLHDQSVRWLRERLSEPFAGKTVVMTHHAPSLRAVPPHRLADPFIVAYASRLDSFIEELQPDLWVFGHIHQSQDFRIGRTRLVANPRGYVVLDPNPAFRPDLVVEI
ncbi:metallophosphoesterase [Sabulicella rubraurantiaca]|uniref:metallophosphoesterase n=1 Tax=Sabulicella rubraurantiaca TaxID=2811429 RepID=UPI001A974FE3|nr:metallophosphoesterase [Sabulicella rubraurantiaca]